MGPVALAVTERVWCVCVCKCVSVGECVCICRYTYVAGVHVHGVPKVFFLVYATHIKYKNNHGTHANFKNAKKTHNFFLQKWGFSRTTLVYLNVFQRTPARCTQQAYTIRTRILEPWRERAVVDIRPRHAIVRRR
jgi:hypothetical protein